MINIPTNLHLKGGLVTLEPLESSHLAELSAAAEDGRLWELTFTSVPSPEKINEWYLDAVEQRDSGAQVPFVVRDNANGQLLGSTRYYDIERFHGNVSIGYTWYRQSAQRTGVNTECKILLLDYAFNVANCAVVYWHTHHENFRSQKAIERLGAKLDGVIRHHKRMPNGSMRDTYSYSMLSTEWPTARAKLQQRSCKLD